MQLSDLVSIITSIGVLGTLVLGFINLYSLRKSERNTRLYNLNMTDYEKRRDYILVNLSEYIHHNILFEEFTSTLDESISLAREVRTENSFAELFNNGLRTPERAFEISNRALELQKKELNKSAKSTIPIDIEANKKEKMDFISEAINSRDEHLKKYLSAAGALITQKENLVTVAQKYLIEDKKQLLSKRKREGKK